MTMEVEWMRFLKVDRTNTAIRKYGWIFAFVVAFGGLWVPRLGLLLIPMMLALGIMGFFRGKYWCGNFCPHGSLFDGIIMPLGRNVPLPGVFKSRLVIWGAFAVFMLGLASRLAPVISDWGALGSWDRLGYVFVFNYLVVTVVGSILGLTINSRAWCAICPMGTFQTVAHGIGSRLGANDGTDLKVYASDTEACRECGKCAMVCPMQLSPYEGWTEEGWFEDERCIKCGICTEHCPFAVIELVAAGDADEGEEKPLERAG